MADIKLALTLKKEDGATAAWMVVDNLDTRITNGKGSVLVNSAKEQHTYVVWVEGPAASSASYEIVQDGFSLAKGKPAVNWGNGEQVEYGVFKHR